MPLPKSGWQIPANEGVPTFIEQFISRREKMELNPIDPAHAAFWTYLIAIIVSFGVAGLIKLMTETIHSFGKK